MSARSVGSCPVDPQSLLRSIPVSAAPSPAHSGPRVRPAELSVFASRGLALLDAILRWRSSVGHSRSGPALPFYWRLRFRPDSVPEGVVVLLSGSSRHGSGRPPEWLGEQLPKLLMHTRWHDLDSPPGSLGYLASTQLRFPLVDPVTDQWDGDSPDRQGSFRTGSRAGRKNRQCPDRRLTLSRHRACPSCGARSCCEKSLSLSD